VTVAVQRARASGHHQRWPGLHDPPRARVRSAIARQIFERAVEQLPVRVEIPDGTPFGSGTTSDVAMVIHRPDDFFARLGTDAKIGFGEAYMVGDWDVAHGTDLADLLTPFAANLTTLVPPPLQRLRRLVDRQQPRHEHATPTQARENIHRHYDLSNDLFAAFLDDTLTYSCAIFGDGDDLEAAQRCKVDAILDMAGVAAGSEVLEIGTGWGQLAIQAAHRGARVTTITLSNEQRRLAQRRANAAGVSQRVDIRLADYREVTGRYDAIVSVEMIEAVGPRYWPAFFATLDRLLRPGGRVGLQAITIAHDRLLATQHSYTWIHKYIFPGGVIPSIEAIETTLDVHTTLRVAERRDIGPHYATTLRCWRERFLERWPTIASERFDDVFKRMWEFYLAYCEAGFRGAYLDTTQLALSRATNR
jgi:cyclopropane-fatty-acyl-phospholipid synthase